jgi:hypothetical protein
VAPAAIVAAARQKSERTMLYGTTFAFIKKNYPKLAAWLQSAIGDPNTTFPDLQNVNGDLIIGPASPDRSNLVRGGLLIWIASGRPLGTDGWVGSKDEVKKMFVGMKDDELKAYLKSNNEWQEPPQPRVVQQVTPVRTGVVQPATRTPVTPQTPVVHARRRSAHGPATGGTPANVVPLATPTTAATSFSKCLPDQGPGTMTSAPGDLIKSKRKDLETLCLYAVGDAKRFNGPKPAQEKEDALRSNENRLKPMKAAEQAAGGVIHYPQSKLKSAYDNTVKAEGAVCTTFALCAAHILTGGTRQSGKVRVEIVGVARNLGTHMYVVCGRAGKNLADLSTWGSNAVIVDLWAAALAGHKSFDTVVKADSDDWRLKSGALGQFYDNARADPKESELAREVNTSSLDRSKKLAELQRLEDDLKNTPKVFKVKHTELSGKIAALKKELKIV